VSLYEATKELHHACEAHPVGQRMVSGAITPQEWADWLWAMRVIHSVIDNAVPGHMARDRALSTDLDLLPPARPSKAALLFSGSLVGFDCQGAAYVLHGAHRSGGRVLAPKMAKRGLPTAHTAYKDPTRAQEWLSDARSKVELVQQAEDTFRCLLAVMDEIEKWRA